MPKTKYTALGRFCIRIGTVIGATLTGIGMFLGALIGALIDLAEMFYEYIEPKIARLFVIEEYEPEWCHFHDPEDPFIHESWHKEVVTSNGPALLMVWRDLDGEYISSYTVVATGDGKVKFLAAKNIDDAKIEAEECWL